MPTSTRRPWCCFCRSTCSEGGFDSIPDVGAFVKMRSRALRLNLSPWSPCCHQHAYGNLFATPTGVRSPRPGRSARRRDRPVGPTRRWPPRRSTIAGWRGCCGLSFPVPGPPRWHRQHGYPPRQSRRAGPAAPPRTIRLEVSPGDPPATHKPDLRAIGFRHRRTVGQVRRGELRNLPGFQLPGIVASLAHG